MILTEYIKLLKELETKGFGNLTVVSYNPDDEYDTYIRSDLEAPVLTKLTNHNFAHEVPINEEECDAIIINWYL